MHIEQHIQASGRSIRKSSWCPAICAGGADADSFTATLPVKTPMCYIYIGASWTRHCCHADGLTAALLRLAAVHVRHERGLLPYKSSPQPCSASSSSTNPTPARFALPAPCSAGSTHHLPCLALRRPCFSSFSYDGCICGSYAQGGGRGMGLCLPAPKTVEGGIGGPMP
jgi:hypothetical protein